MWPLRSERVPAHQPHPFCGARAAALAGFLPVGVRGLPPETVLPQRWARPDGTQVGQQGLVELVGLRLVGVRGGKGGKKAIEAGLS